jgi:putative sterol carrier protein
VNKGLLREPKGIEGEDRQTCEDGVEGLFRSKDRFQTHHPKGAGKMANYTTQEVFQEIEKRLKENPKPIEGMKAVYQFDLSGDDGAVYQLHLADGAAKVEQGEAATADCTIQMTAADFKDMLLGNLNPTAAFMSGKLKVKGNLGLAMKLQNVLGQYEPPRA